MPKGDAITCLDIGTGASCIYPIIGVVDYDWNFIASDIDQNSLANARKIISLNASLQGKVECRLQGNVRCILRGIIQESERIDLSICNPPFFASVDEAVKAAKRKVKNLSGGKNQEIRRNFSGNQSELIYRGGELNFIKRMIVESVEFAKQCCWFSSLVSREANLNKIYGLLKKNNARDVMTVPIKTGNKSSRFVAWTFLDSAAMGKWRQSHWD